jgi:hypothetical protein
MAIAQYSSQKKSPRRKARDIFGAPAGISPIGDKLRLSGSSRKKILPPKGERIFLVLQRGFPLSGINFDSPGAAGKKFSRRKAREFFGAPAGIRTPDTLLKRQVLCLLSYWGISV